MILAAKLWQEGRLDSAETNSDEAKKCLEYLLRLPHADLKEKYVQDVLSLLLMNNIGRQFNIIAEHGKWVRMIFELCEISGSFYLQDVVEKKKEIESYNLAKYGPEEIGLSLKLYQHNTCQLKTDNKNTHDEDILDIIATRLQKYFKGHNKVDVNILMHIPDSQLTAHRPYNRHQIKSKLHYWRKAISLVVKVPTNQHAKLKQWCRKSGIELVTG